MLIDLNKYKIEIDSNKNHTLYTRAISKDGKPTTWKVVGYYAKVSSALYSLINKEIATTNETLTILEYIERLEKVYEEINKGFEDISIKFVEKYNKKK